MVSDKFGQFLLTAAVLTPVGLVAAAALAPPDPFTLAAATAAMAPFVLGVSYVLAYRRGLEWF